MGAVLLLSVLASASATQTLAAVEKQQESTHLRNAFGIYASEVWRYKSEFKAHDLTPTSNEFAIKNNPKYKHDPTRFKPGKGVLSKDGTRLYVNLMGVEHYPGHEMAVVDVEKGTLIKKIKVGSRPYQSVLHPGGRFILVTNEFSNYISVIDTNTDENVGNIPLDYYGQGIAITRDGSRAYVAVRYLDQVMVVDLKEENDTLTGKVRVVGGFSEPAFYGTDDMPESLRKEMQNRGIAADKITETAQEGLGGINAILRGRCKSCHIESAGGFESGPDKENNFLSAIENTVPGKPFESPLLRAVIPKSMGGFGDDRVTTQFHPGGALFKEGEPELDAIVNWIKNAENGPGIRVSMKQSHPKDVTLSTDERYLFVGNTGTQDISIIDTDKLTEIGGFFVQNVTTDVGVYHDEKSGRDLLIALSMGAGFGTPKERDPYGGETLNPDNPAAEFTVLRDFDTTDAYPVEQQHLMGPFEGIDGTWNFKMRDIQNDVLLIDLAKISFPQQVPEKLDYLAMVNKYESHDDWVRYTSDTAEATTGDIKGDIPPELQRVPGAMPEEVVFDGDHMFVTMSGSFELVEWKINPDAEDPSERLVPLRTWETGIRPQGVVVGKSGPAKGKLFVMNMSSESVSVIDRSTNKVSEIVVGNGLKQAPLTTAEFGSLVFHTTILSSDGDTSCSHCHFRDSGDGRGWGAAEVVGQRRDGHLTSGGTLGIPQVKNLFGNEPFYFEGTHLLAEGQGADINEAMSSIDFDRPIWAGDFSHYESHVPLSERRLMHEELKERVEVRKLGDEWYDLEARREAFIKQQTKRYFGKEYTLRDLYGFMGEWMGYETRLLPNPFDKESPSFKRGERLFNSANVMCGVCHTAPTFVNKTSKLADNDRRAMPSLTTLTRRDASYSLASVFKVEAANGDPLGLERNGDPGRIEIPEGSFTTMHLRGIFDRPPVFLHHGRTRSLREVLLTPNHPGAREFRYPVYMGDEIARKNRMEVGFNETTSRNEDGSLNHNDRVLDTHGGTSHLTPRQVDDLENFLMGIE